VSGDATFDGNTAASGDGGAIRAGNAGDGANGSIGSMGEAGDSGSVTVSVAATFTDNSAGGDGGAIRAGDGGDGGSSSLGASGRPGSDGGSVTVSDNATFAGVLADSVTDWSDPGDSGTDSVTPTPTLQ